MIESASAEKSLRRRIKQHVIGKDHLFFAIVQPGFEDTARDELRSIGIKKFGETVEGGIEFYSRLDVCYAVNLSSRAVSRIIMRLARFRAERFNKLLSRVRDFPWELYLNRNIPLEFKVTAAKSRLYHKERIKQEFDKGISSRLTGPGISADTASHDKKQKIFVRIDDNICQVSIDTSGELLYKRGYKRDTGGAPIRETLAALILLEAKLTSYDILIDPMCGTGTFAIEGTEIFLNKLPGTGRDFIFEEWPAFKSRAFNHLKKKLENSMDQGAKKFLVYASDKSPGNIKIALANRGHAGLIEHINLEERDFFKDIIPLPENKKSLIVINPPYGERLGGINLQNFYRKIGETIRYAYPGSGYAIISPSVEFEKIMSLSYDKKILFMNGGIKVAVIIRYA